MHKRCYASYFPSLPRMQVFPGVFSYFLGLKYSFHYRRNDMATSKILLLAGCLTTFTFSAHAKMDKKETIKGVVVQSGKSNSTRYYSGSISKVFPYQLSMVKNSIVNFDQKCNNSFKERRQYTDKTTDCKYHNDNLVETIVIKDIKTSGWKKEAGEIERYILGRRVYNRGNFGYYELVKILEGHNEQNQKTLTIVQTMLSDKEAKTYINPSFERDSAFDEATATFQLTEVNNRETEVQYQYNAETEHWVLNKEVSVPQVFSSISKSINDLFKTVDAESVVQSRDLASN